MREINISGNGYIRIPDGIELYEYLLKYRQVYGLTLKELLDYKKKHFPMHVPSERSLIIRKVMPLEDKANYILAKVICEFNNRSWWIEDAVRLPDFSLIKYFIINTFSREFVGVTKTIITFYDSNNKFLFNIYFKEESSNSEKYFPINYR